MPLSIKTYINELKGEKFRASIIHSKNETKSSDFIKRAATELNGKYLNVLNLFENEAKLTDSLDYFDPAKLVALLKKESKEENLVFVDHISFLWDTWNDSDKQDFLLMIEKQWNSFYTDTKATLVFNLPTDYTVINTSIIDASGRSRVKEMNEFSAII